mgnify:CR=1 FL=1
MLNIEVIKFEAQDVITASGVASVPATQLKPACICNGSPVGIHHSNSKTGVHEIQMEDGSWVRCPSDWHVK